MAINFPSSPAVNDTYTAASKTWLYNGRGWVLQPVAGTNGQSAYEIAVAHGFVGTEAAWLATLQGTDGVDGVDGVDGAPGADGADGQGLALKGSVANSAALPGS